MRACPPIPRASVTARVSSPARPASGSRRSISGVRRAHDDDLVDPTSWFDALRRGAAAVDGWHRGGMVGTRPPGHLREHAMERVTGARRWGRGLIHAVVLDPDGRPLEMRRRNAF